MAMSGRGRVNGRLTSVPDILDVSMKTLERTITVEVAHNVRHLGGYARRDGGRTAAHDIFRSAGLHRLTEGGIAALREAGVRTIIDFRSDQEREREVTPDVEAFGIRALHAPVFQHHDASPTGLAQDEFPGYGYVYQRFLEIGRNAYRSFFQAVASSEGGVLFHCAAGKDRTGVAAALLLELADTHHDEIVADYTLTETLLQPLFDEWLPQMKERGISEERARKLMGAPKEAIETALATIREEHGGAESYMRSLGLSTTTISAVRARVAG